MAAGNSTEFEFEDIKRYTNNFSADRRVGSGGFGDFYRGILTNGDEITVKRFHPLLGIEGEKFENEYRTLLAVNHKNIIRLIGYSYEPPRRYVELNGKLVSADMINRVLCFEFMHGGRLDGHISGDSCTLEWPKCYHIIKGTCEGLDHLHNSQKKPIFHMDLKPANILLDKNVTAKIANFGLSKFVASTETYNETEKFARSLGFMPPEYINISHVSEKFDVFSLGVIIIKIMDGKRGHYSRLPFMCERKFIELVCEKWRIKLWAKSKCSSDEMEMKQVKKCIQIALKCVKHDPNNRPSIKYVVQELEELEDEIKKMTAPSGL